MYLPWGLVSPILDTLRVFITVVIAVIVAVVG
jgi:hypothetical protein